MDPYRILGISSNASDEEIKRAYRKLAKQYHPDINKEAGAEEKFKQIQNAYDTIMKMRKEGPSYSNYSYQQSYQNTQNQYSSQLQAATNYINAGYYHEALNILEGIIDKNGYWYYLHAICNMQLRNPIVARSDAQNAVAMEPNNMQYRALLQRLEGTGQRYSYYQQPYGSTNTSDLCCQCLRYYLICQCCIGGGMPVFCCI